MAAPATVTGSAPALADPHRPLDRTHPTAWATVGWRRPVGEHGGRVCLAELVDQWTQPTQLGRGQHR
jgi:hypothetical protein